MLILLVQVVLGALAAGTLGRLHALVLRRAGRGQGALGGGYRCCHEILTTQYYDNCNTCRVRFRLAFNQVAVSKRQKHVCTNSGSRCIA